jgi:hypothetical protein
MTVSKNKTKNPLSDGVVITGNLGAIVGLLGGLSLGLYAGHLEQTNLTEVYTQAAKCSQAQECTVQERASVKRVEFNEAMKKTGVGIAFGGLVLGCAMVFATRDQEV